MPELLLELFSEEIPARMQRDAAENLKKIITNALVDRGITYEGAQSFATPRRLVLHIVGLPASQPDVREEKKGPRVGAPEAALAGFLKSAGLASINEAKIQSDPKGDFYVAIIEKKGGKTIDVLADIITQTIRTFPWPKSQRWGDGSLRWVRPLKSICATFGSENDEPEIVPVEVEGLCASNITYGHRFHAPEAIKIKRFADYVESLHKARVILDPARRMDMIRADAANIAFAKGLEVVEDEVLVAEVAGLVEWPVVLLGTFDEAFLSVPPEVIRATIRANQKCFVLKNASTQQLSNHFILVSNLEAKDGGKAIAAGNARVIRARLSDAKFFYETDLKVPLLERLEKLKSVTFHQKLGTQFNRVERMMHLARKIAPLVGANPDDAATAAQLCKADLATEMVGEFPELQGLMGRYYYLAQGGKNASIAAAIEDHYRPQGPTDRVPNDPVAIAVALADKLDILTGFWAIDEKPTGSKDPFALRRAALGVIRIILESNLRLDLGYLLTNSGDLMTFMLDRLKVQLREQGVRHDYVEASLQTGHITDLWLISQKIEALQAMLKTEDGQNLLAGYKRAANILKAEEKKDGEGAFNQPVNPSLMNLPQEAALQKALNQASSEVKPALEQENFDAAMSALAALRAPIDAFFADVTVNDADPAIRTNRLSLLASLRATMHTVADFSRIEG